MRCFFLFLIASAQIALGDDASLAVAEAHARAGKIFHGETPRPDENRGTLERLLRLRDPETSAASFVHGIRRHSARLLTEEQAKRWVALIAEWQPRLGRLHDERNVLRGFFFARAWRLPGLKGPDRDAAMAELALWLEVWLGLTGQERLAQHHLWRASWDVLTAEQRGALARGDWDRHVRKTTGHQRAYFGDRVVLRAMGKPDNAEAFADRSRMLEREQRKVQQELLESERRWRILTFAQPPVEDAVLVAEWRRTSAALAAFFTDQVHHIIGLTEAGYDLGSRAVRERIEAQPARELGELEEKVRTKLPAGSDLLEKLLAAGR